VNRTSRYGHSPVYCAVGRSQAKLQCLRMLLAARADVDYVNDGCAESPLQRAASENDSEAVGLLLAAKANVDPNGLPKLLPPNSVHPGVRASSVHTKESDARS
jgi:hypothetical protein